MNKSEFTSLYLEAEPALYRISKSILKNEFDCADAVQEAIVKAFAKINTLREEKYFKTWICRILIHECYRIYASRKKTVSLEDYTETVTAYEQHRDMELYDSIMRLNTAHRIVVTLYYIEGFKTSEISEMLKISEGTVKSRLSRARSELKILLDEEENDINEKNRLGQCIPRSI